MKTKPITKELQDQITRLHDALEKEFGCDFAYTIMGTGHKVATSNMIDGRIQPVNGVPTVIPNTHHVVQNLIGGRDVVQAKDTPLCCDVSSETYHSM